jgi:hypothetical protein
VAAVLRLQATAGDLGAAADPLELAVARLAAAATGEALTLLNQGALSVGPVAAVDRQRVADDGTVETLAGDAALAGLSGAGFVRLDTEGGLALEVGAPVIAGGSLRLVAAGAAADLRVSDAVSAGSTSSLMAGRDLMLAAAFTVAGGGLTLEAGRHMDLAAVAVADADAWLSAGGVLTLQSLDLGAGRLAVRAASVVDGDGGSAVNVRAGAVRLAVDGAVGMGGDALETEAATLALQAGGDAFVHDRGGLRVASVEVAVSRVGEAGEATALPLDAQAGLQVAGRLVLVATDGGLTIDAVSVIGSGRFETDGGVLSLNAALAAAGPVSLLTLGDLALAAAGDIAVAAGASVDLETSGNLSMADGATITAVDGGLRLAAGGSLSLGSLLTGGGVSLLARTIGDSGSDDLDVAASALRVVSTGSGTSQGFGSGARALQLQVGTLAADVAGTGAGGFFAVEADGLVVGLVGPLGVQRVAADGSLGLQVDAALADIVSGGNLILVSSTGDLTVADGDSDGLGLQAGGNVRLDAVTGALALEAGLHSAAGHASLLAGGDLRLGADVVLERSGRTVDIAAGGELAQAAGTVVATLNSDQRWQAAGTLTVDRLTAGSGRVSLNGADIREAGSDAEVEVAASALRAVSADGIGAAADRFETQVGTVAARAAGGGIWLQESDAIRVTDVGVSVQRVGLSGTVSAVADAPLSDLVTTAGNGSIGLATSNGDIDLFDGTAPADGRSLSVHGSGRILLDVQGDGAVLDVGGAGLAQAGDITLGSDLRVQGLFEITAGVGAGTGGITIDAAVDGNPGAAADTLVLHADGGPVEITGPIGASAPLAGLRIDGATDVTLAGPLTLTGDLVIEASGIVRIDGAVDLGSGTLRIVGAQRVMLGDVALDGGDFIVATDALSLGGRVSSSDGAAVQISAARADGSVGIGGSGSDLVIDPALLSRLDGFGALYFGGADSAALRMADGATLDTGGRALTLSAAGDIAVSRIEAGTARVVLDSAAGTIAESGSDAAVDVVAGWLTMRGHGPALDSGASSAPSALEIQTARVDIDARQGLVLRDSAPDGSVRYNLLADGVLYQQVQAATEVPREASSGIDATPSEVAERVLALRAADGESDVDRWAAGELRRHALHAGAVALPGLQLTAAPPEAGGWLAQRLAASTLLAGRLASGEVDPLQRVELWADPLEL